VLVPWGPFAATFIERWMSTIECKLHECDGGPFGFGLADKAVLSFAVAYKLSKISKNDEILSMLHSLLFHKRAKVFASSFLT
jgi:hypothetical protein